MELLDGDLPPAGRLSAARVLRTLSQRPTRVDSDQQLQILFCTLGPSPLNVHQKDRLEILSSRQRWT